MKNFTYMKRVLIKSINFVNRSQDFMNEFLKTSVVVPFVYQILIVNKIRKRTSLKHPASTVWQLPQKRSKKVLALLRQQSKPVLIAKL